MQSKRTIALLRERKVAPDRRVVFTPAQSKEIEHLFQVDVVVESSAIRCFPDEEFRLAGIEVTDTIPKADIYFGVKEVPIDYLVPNSTYLFFSHTIKKQASNRKLLLAILEKKIRLIDYEVLTDDHGTRVAAFGYYAGVVGAHNAIYAFGKRTGKLHLPRIKHLHDYAEAQAIYESLDLPPVRVVVTGTGRVGKGVVRVLRDMGLKQVTPAQFLSDEIAGYPCFTVLGSAQYVCRINDGGYDRDEFYHFPERYTSAFAPYSTKADVFINAILWKTTAPVFFSVRDMASPDFRIQTIADITCDIAPASSVPSTIRASSIDDPVYGFDPATGREIAPYQPHGIDIMAIDNLPSELPRDASTAFGAALLETVIPQLFSDVPSHMITQATIAENGRLTAQFAYLQNYVDGVE